MRIFTHVNPDLDALMSVVAARLYYPAARGAEIILKPANWDGAGMDPDDIAVDMEAGGRGMKGEKGDGVVHSCFALIMTKYAPTAECLALAPVIACGIAAAPMLEIPLIVDIVTPKKIIKVTQKSG